MQIAMQTYELFFILPGTLDETEVKPEVEIVAGAVAEVGTVSAAVQSLGKSRLAYPMRQIRYGYFQTCRFQAESSAIPLLQGKLSVMKNVLRAIIRRVNAATMTIDKVSVVSDVFSREPGELQRESLSRALASPEAATHRLDTMPPKEALAAVGAAKTETRPQDVKIDDLDKKLDELLQGDIASV